MASAVRRLTTKPWDVFVLGWNWKAAFTSAAIRGVLFCAAVHPRGTGAARGAWIEIGFRIVLGGCWASLIQEMRHVRPAWVAAALVAVVVPAGAHALEFAALKCGGATQIKSAMIASILFSVVSVLANFLLMRHGFMLTGKGTPSFASDLRRILRLS